MFRNQLFFISLHRHAGRNRLDQRKRIFALFLDCESGPFAKNAGIREKVFHCYVCVLHNIQWSMTIFFISHFGSPDPAVRNKERLGGSTLFVVVKINALGASE